MHAVVLCSRSSNVPGIIYDRQTCQYWRLLGSGYCRPRIFIKKSWACTVNFVNVVLINFRRYIAAKQYGDRLRFRSESLGETSK